MCNLTEVTFTTQSWLFLGSSWSGASWPSHPSRPKLSGVYRVLSTRNEAAAPHTPIQNQMQEVHYQVVQPPSWENKDPTNRLCSGHKGGGESVKAISPPPNGSHTQGPFGILQGWSYAARFQGLPSFKIKDDNQRATVNVLPTNQLK